MIIKDKTCYCDASWIFESFKWVSEWVDVRKNGKEQRVKWSKEKVSMVM